MIIHEDKKHVDHKGSHEVCSTAIPRNGEGQSQEQGMIAGIQYRFFFMLSIPVGMGVFGGFITPAQPVTGFLN